MMDVPGSAEAGPSGNPDDGRGRTSERHLRADQYLAQPRMSERHHCADQFLGGNYIVTYFIDLYHRTDYMLL